MLSRSCRRMLSAVSNLGRAQLEPLGLRSLSSSSSDPDAAPLDLPSLSSSDPNAAPPYPPGIAGLMIKYGLDKGDLIKVVEKFASDHPFVLDELSQLLEKPQDPPVDLDELVQNAGLDAGLVSSIKTVQKLIGYEFKNPKNTIFIALSKSPTCQVFKNQAKTGYLASNLMIAIYLENNENMSRIMTNTLCDANLAKLSKSYNLPSMLHRPRHRTASSPLKGTADILKAILGAVLMDSDKDLVLFKQVVLSMIPLEPGVENAVPLKRQLTEALNAIEIEGFDVKKDVVNGVTTYNVYEATYGDVIGTGFSKEEAMDQGLKYIKNREKENEGRDEGGD